jgi:putative Mg2+ transporter-C (MgtC) family protein
MLTQGEVLIGPGEVFLRLGIAMLIGGTLGLNRELHAKPAGLRTHALVSLGAALITLVGIEMIDPATQMDSVLRVVQGVMAGIGFLGGGVILRDDSQHRVHGLTTAASLWVAACLGIGCGAGQWMTALAALGLTLLVLIVGGPLERFAIHRIERLFGKNGPPPPDGP